MISNFGSEKNNYFGEIRRNIEHQQYRNETIETLLFCNNKKKNQGFTLFVSI
jgi:hypothetical protein